MSEAVELSHTPPSTREQIERAENAQILIAIAVLSGYLNLITNPESPFQSFSFALNLLAFVALCFLAGKLATLTLRPFYDHPWLQAADRKVLPGVFVVIFFVGLAIIIPSVIPLPEAGLPFIDIDDFIRWISQPVLGPVTPANIYIIISGVVSIWAALQYASWTAEIMSDLETAAPNVRITFTSGEQGQTFPLTLRNPRDIEIPPEDIRIEIYSTSGVDVDIPQAKELGENVWRPRLAIPPNERMNISIQITRSEGVEDISEESVEIVTKYLGHTKQTQMVELEG